MSNAANLYEKPNNTVGAGSKSRCIGAFNLCCAAASIDRCSTIHFNSFIGYADVWNNCELWKMEQVARVIKKRRKSIRIVYALVMDQKYLIKKSL